jgi:hypothetical protein
MECRQAAPESLKAIRIADGRERTVDSSKEYIATTSQPGSDVFFLADVRATPATSRVLRCPRTVSCRSDFSGARRR